jgi:hypothetical protein
VTVADRKLDAANQKIAVADRKVIEADRKVAEADRKGAEADRKVIEAEDKITEANQKVVELDQQIAAAKETLDIAQAGTQLEQDGNSALQLFETNQSGGLLRALEIGKGLQDLIARRAKVKDAMFSKDRQLALAQYPALSPYGGLLRMVNTIEERPIPTHQGSVNSVSWTNDGQTLATLGLDGTVKFWPIENLDTLLVRGCNWLDTYLIYTPQDLRKLKACHTDKRNRAAAHNLIAESDKLAKEGESRLCSIIRRC